MDVTDSPLMDANDCRTPASRSVARTEMRTGVDQLTHLVDA